jgi:hypothetical protein
MSRTRALVVAVVASLLPLAAGAQVQTTARTGVVFESYSFGSGLAFDRVSEMSIPLTVTNRFGRWVTVDVGTTFASAKVRDASGTVIDHSGLTDTDIRAAVTVIPSRLILTVIGTLPTGASEVPDTTIPLFGATATGLLGFTTPGFGSGGGISAGFASAFKLGQNWAVGTGASYRHGGSYTPVAGGSELTPGGEVRARLGLEGPFSRGKYFRGALIVTSTGANDVGGGRESVIGARVLAYGAMSMPFGRGSLSVYGWEMRRLRATHFDDTSAVAVPRGNVLALGARLTRPISPTLTVVPLLEFRHELTGPTDKMELLGYLVRTGADLRYRLNANATGVVQAQLAFGTINDEGRSVSLFGPRIGALIEWSR